MKENNMFMQSLDLKFYSSTPKRPVWTGKKNSAGKKKEKERNRNWRVLLPALKHLSQFSLVERRFCNQIKFRFDGFFFFSVWYVSFAFVRVHSLRCLFFVCYFFAPVLWKNYLVVHTVYSCHRSFNGDECIVLLFASNNWNQMLSADVN